MNSALERIPWVVPDSGRVQALALVGLGPAVAGGAPESHRDGDPGEHVPDPLSVDRTILDARHHLDLDPEGPMEVSPRLHHKMKH